jgi:hypothetical protein
MTVAAKVEAFNGAISGIDARYTLAREKSDESHQQA